MEIYRLLNSSLSLIFIMSSVPFTSAVARATFVFTNEMDRQALVAIKELIPGDPFGVLHGWNSSFHFCQWQGVTCGRLHERVTVLDLGSLKLVGSVSPHIGNLTFLKALNLSNNSFHGTIPAEMGRLFRLQHLRLQNNSFQGEFPTNLSSCSDITVINLNGNKLEGKIPTELGFLSNLLSLRLSKNNFTGRIPPSLGNITALRALNLVDNNLHGNIPFELGRLSNIVGLQLSSNSLSGVVPPLLYNISSIRNIFLTQNKLCGSLPPDFGLTLPNLQNCGMGGNKFSGPFPQSIGNISGLIRVDIGDNNFTGHVPTNLGSLHALEHLSLNRNQFGTNKSNDFSFLNSLVNCTKLRVLMLGKNSFGGVFPKSVVNLSTTLTLLRLNDNYITGSIPQEIANLINLDTLLLYHNMLTGSIPESIGKLSKLRVLYLNKNKISGKIPSSIGNITGVYLLSLETNMLEGSIPAGLGNCTNLQGLDLKSNRLTGEIPEQIIGQSSLTIGLFLSQNQLSGPLPSQVGNLKNLGLIDISRNKLSGEIPIALGNCKVMEYLYMQDNLFRGTIPSSLKQLRGIQVLNLSGNSLNGNIPSFLGDLLVLQKLNLSHNMFQGEVPTENIFQNISAFSVVRNMNLCGGIHALQLPPCPREVPVKKKNSLLHRIVPLLIVAPTLLLLACLSTIVYRLKRSIQQTSTASMLKNQYPKLSYAELRQATDGFSSYNLIGEGRYGSVYKGILKSGQQIVAVKVLNLQRHGANKSFLAECEALKNLRHRNLVKIITSCSSIDFQGSDFKALVFEFMTNGSLEEWLHPDLSEQQDPKNLTLLQRLNIAMDVASALDHLHLNCEATVIHCDLKPSNVLLDNDLCAHVGDFGLSRFLLSRAGDQNHQSATSVGIRGTIGYVAPEYGMGMDVSTHGDMYSYGVLLLEMFTGKRPTDSMFANNNFSLHNYVKMNLPDKVMEIVDPQIDFEEADDDASNQTRRVEGGIAKRKSCLTAILRIGMLCSAELPKDRLDIKDVVVELNAIRNLFLG